MVQKCTSRKIDNIKAISLAPTSGLQPFEVIVITNQEVKEKSDLFLNQSVVTDCSHLFVFAAWILTLQTALTRCLI
jgi:nitroreductase